MKNILLLLLLSIDFFILFYLLSKINYNNTEFYKLNVVIPIRDREKELSEIINVLEKIFKKQKIIPRYYIIEQEEGKRFNKGKISNIGFLESIKNNFSDNYLFNDVDLYPKKYNIINYRKNNKNKIIHPYGHRHCIGGFFLVNKNSFKNVNGYSNDYWGWGGEDTDLNNRFLSHNILIDRNNFIEREKGKKLIKDDDSGTWKKNINNPSKEFIENQNMKEYKNKLYKYNSENTKKDGLSNCEYKILSKVNYKNNPKMIRIKVSI